MMSALLASAIAGLSTASDEEAVLGVVDDFFVALEAVDTSGFQAMMHEDAQLQSVRRGEDGQPQLGMTTRDGWLASLEGRAGKIVELYWDPVVQISPVGLAHVWAPYYIEYEGAPIHCGVDAFTLVKTGEAWMITNLHDTRDPQGCDRLGLDDAFDRMRPESLKPRLTKFNP